jgi:hypothetical protein
MFYFLHARHVNVIKGSGFWLMKNGIHMQGAATVGTLVIAAEVPVQKTFVACPELNFGPLIKSTLSVILSNTFVDAPGKYGNTSMPEQVKRPNPWRKKMKMMMMMMMMTFEYIMNQVSHEMGNVVTC